MGELLTINDQISIPLSEIEITASRSGGAGGQHVNKTSTKITVRWNIRSSLALSDDQKNYLMSRLGSALTIDGDLIISNSSSRSQTQNKEAALSQLRTRIRQALYVPKKRIKTGVSLGAKEQRLHKKKARSDIKKMRSKKDFYD